MNERRSYLILMGLILAALIGVAARGSRLAAPEVADLGLDLQGGLEVVKEGPRKGPDGRRGGLDDAVTIINDRINSTGVAEPEIRKQGDNQIVIELPGVDDQERAADLIGQTAKLELYDLQAISFRGRRRTPGRRAPARLALRPPREPADRRQGRRAVVVLPGQGNQEGNRTEYKLVVGPKSTRQAVLASPYVKKNRLEKGELPKGTKLLLVPENMVVTTCGQAQRYCPGSRRPTELSTTSSATTGGRARQRPDPGDVRRRPRAEGNEAGLRLRRGPDQRARRDHAVYGQGADRFEEITRRLVERGRAKANRLGITDKNQNDVANQQFAIVLDRVIQSAPTVDFDDNPAGIPGNNGAIITGVSIQEAKDLAIVLRSGTLPFKLVTISQTNISATLGKDSLQEAKLAAIGGLIVVASRSSSTASSASSR